MNQEKKIITIDAVQKAINNQIGLFIHKKTLIEIMNIIDQFQNPPAIKKCDCDPDKKTGETEMLVMCCNICGKPDDGAIGRIGTPAIKLPSNLEQFEESDKLKETEKEFHEDSWLKGINYVLNYIRQSK